MTTAEVISILKMRKTWLEQHLPNHPASIAGVQDEIEAYAIAIQSLEATAQQNGETWESPK